MVGSFALVTVYWYTWMRDLIDNLICLVCATVFEVAAADQKDVKMTAILICFPEEGVTEP